MKFGYEGLGLFYTLLEKIGKQEKPVKTSVLKCQLKVGKRLEKCWSFMEQIGIIHSNNGETFNKQLLNFSETYQIKKEKNAKRILEWREKQKVDENVTHSESVSNTPKVKESKVNRSKVKIVFGIPQKIEVEDYFIFQNSTKAEAESFYDHYQSNGWLVGGKSKMKDWQAASRNWIKNSIKFSKNGNTGNNTKTQIRANLADQDYSKKL